MATTIAVPEIRIGRVKVTLVGTALLCTHNWSEKAKREMLDKHQGKATKKKDIKVPAEDFRGGLHEIDPANTIVNDEDEANVYATGDFGFPCKGLKAAIVRAATDAGMKMTDIRRAIRVPGELMKIDSDRAVMRQDMVRVGMGQPDIRFRPEFTEWSITQEIQWNKAVLTQEQLFNLIRIAGFGVGLGEMRPERGGDWGTFVLSQKVETLPDEVYGK